MAHLTLTKKMKDGTTHTQTIKLGPDLQALSDKMNSEEAEYKRAKRKAFFTTLSPLGAITGWGQGDYKRMTAERRQKAKMDELIAAVKESQQIQQAPQAPQEPQIAFKYCNQCGARVPLTAAFCGGCGKAIERATRA